MVMVPTQDVKEKKAGQKRRENNVQDGGTSGGGRGVAGCCTFVSLCQSSSFASRRSSDAMTHHQVGTNEAFS